MVEKRLHNNKLKLQENEIGEFSFERKKRKIEKWADEAKEKIEQKKSNYLTLYGNLGEFANIIKKNKTFPKRDLKNPSLSDSEIKLSEDISHSGFSQRHGRQHSEYLRNDGRNHMRDGRNHMRDGRNHMRDGRNHMRDGNLHKIVTRENNKSIDGFNSQKETDKLTERLSNLEIFQDTDQSFSTKGPVVAKNEPGNHWRIDEVDPKVKNNLNLKDFHEKNQESEEENLENERLKEFLENKI